jgi:predicted DNA-binding protein (UPF0251 family)
VSRPTFTERELLKQADVELARAERMLKIAQVARMANVSRGTVWNDILKGALKAERRLIHKRHRIRVDRDEAIRYATCN